MLGMPKYSKKYVENCQQRIDDCRALYKKAGKSLSKEFEAAYFNNLVVVLDHMFVHRLMKIEGKDGNPLNEVRVLCNSLHFNSGKLQIDKLPGWPESAGSGLKLAAEKSVLKLKQGDKIQLSEADFTKLANEFFKEMKRKFV